MTVTVSQLIQVRPLFLLSTWYVTSSVAVLLTKILFSGSRTLHPFPFALTVTATNNVVASLVANVFFNPVSDINRQCNVNRVALIIGATTAAEIGLSNLALILLSISYATILKGMAPLFVMAWGVVFGLQQVRRGLVCAFIAIAVGLSMAVAGKTLTKPTLSNFLNAGFCAQFSSALLSGFRWTLTQVFIQGQEISNERLTPIFETWRLRRGLSGLQTIRLTAPYTFLSVFPFVALMEGASLMRWFSDAAWKDLVVVSTGLTIIGLCVYLLLWSEYELVKATSSLTVSVAFVLKEVLLLVAGVVFFEDELSGLAVTGFVIAQCGIVGYAVQKQRKKSDAGLEQEGDDVL